MFELATIKSGLPSPSISAIATDVGPVPVKKSTFDAIDVASKTFVPGIVTLNGEAEYAVNPLTVTVIGWYVTPAGTVSVSCVNVAAVTVARTAPNHTILLAGVVLKFVPVIVTVVPI